MREKLGVWFYILLTLRWRHNGRDGVSNHQTHDCLLNRLFRRRSKETLKLGVSGLCAGNSPMTSEFPAQMASNAEKCFHLMTSSCNLWYVQIITADGRIRLFAHFTNSLPSLCKNVRKHWTCKMCVTCILSSVCLKLSIFSESSYVQYMALCDISLPNSLLVIMTIFLFHFIIIIKSEIRLISNYFGLGNEIIVIDLCLIVFSCLLIRSLLQSNGIKWEGIRFVVWHTL